MAAKESPPRPKKLSLSVTEPGASCMTFSQRPRSKGSSPVFWASDTAAVMLLVYGFITALPREAAMVCNARRSSLDEVERGRWLTGK